ncbi:hypothetical protein RYD26_12730, partial [Pasteurellaceae bacterium LIM206]|nr:hypothetical protein [Pasteurellaceae bacterium LIM206]
IPEKDIKGGTDVTAKTEDPSGNKSEPTTKSSVDTDAPAAPDVDPQADGSVVVTPKDDSSKTTIDYTDENGNSKQIIAEKGKDGKWTITDSVNNPDVTIDPNTGKITIPEKDIKGGTDVTA